MDKSQQSETKQVFNYLKKNNQEQEQQSINSNNFFLFYLFVILADDDDDLNSLRIEEHQLRDAPRNDNDTMLRGLEENHLIENN
jgi:hypothetical protein